MTNLDRRGGGGITLKPKTTRSTRKHRSSNFSSVLTSPSERTLLRKMTKDALLSRREILLGRTTAENFFGINGYTSTYYVERVFSENFFTRRMHFRACACTKMHSAHNDTGAPALLQMLINNPQGKGRTSPEPPHSRRSILLLPPFVHRIPFGAFVQPFP